MSHESHPASSLFTQVDISASTHVSRTPAQPGADEHLAVLRNLLAAQDRQNELLEELTAQFSAAQRQRNAELGQWKQANPALARNCRTAAEALSRVQLEFLNTLTEEINENADSLLDGEFMLSEFIDRFGPRMAHLNGMLQVLAQLSSTPNPTNG